MLSTSSLNTFLLATGGGDGGGELVRLLELSQSVTSRIETGRFLALAQSVSGSEKYAYETGVSQTVNAIAGGHLVAITQQVLGDAWFRPMHGQHSIGFDGENYTIRVFVGGKEVDPCHLLKTCEISYSENEAATASLFVKEDCGLIDLYKFYNQRIQIFAQSKTYIYPLFDGVVDTPEIDLLARSRMLTATNDRNGSIEKLSNEALSQIGYWCESVFGEMENYTSQNAQLADRLSTIPASFDFNANGQGVLSSWLPKNQPDWVLHNCDCYARNSSFKLNPATGIVNRAEVRVYHQYERLFHREVAFSYVYNGYTSDFEFVLNVPHEGPPPTFNDVFSAATGAGWLVGNFRSKGTPPSGWYGNIYFNAAEYEYEYQPTGESDRNGNPIVNVVQVAKTSLHDLYAMSASWTAAKRWKQSIEESYDLVIQNSASMRIHGTRTEKFSYTIKHDASKSKLAARWGNEKKYSRPEGKQMDNGDYVVLLDNVLPNEYSRAMECIYNVVYTKILETHRNNELSLCVKFAPKISLADTVGIDTNRYVGHVKIMSYVHKFDFMALLGATELVGANFSNPTEAEKELTPAPNPPYRPALPLYKYDSSIRLRDYVVPYRQKIIELEPDDDTDDRATNFIPVGTGRNGFKLYNCNGYVRAETGHIYKGYSVKRGYAFRVQTDDIEAGSTDTLNLEGHSSEIEVVVPNNKFKVLMECF